MFTKSSILRWRKYNQNYFLQGNKCLECKKKYYPAIYFCSCGSTKFEIITLSGIGKLLSFTQIINSTIVFKKQVPYSIGIIELEMGLKLIMQLTDVIYEELKVGMLMQACFRKIYSSDNQNIINYGLKFIPLLRN